MHIGIGKTIFLGKESEKSGKYTKETQTGQNEGWTCAAWIMHKLLMDNGNGKRIKPLQHTRIHTHTNTL